MDFCCWKIILTQMHTVSMRNERDVRPVIYDEERAGARGDPPQGMRQSKMFMLIMAFIA
ncbi:MAG: hypothetical protein STSR0002_12740 [Smithella sp.]